MKKTLSVILVISLLLCLFAGCESKGKSNIKIGFAAPAATHGWVAGVAYYAEKYCKENGIDYVMTTSENADEMKNCIDALIGDGVQALVLWPQWSGMEDTVDAVVKKGIPVVSFDVDIASDGVHKVTGNNYDMGYQCAKYITDKVGDGASIAVLNVPSIASVSQLRKEGFEDYLKEINYDDSKVFSFDEEEFSRDCGYADMKKILAEHEKIDAVFSMDDETSIGVVKAVTEAGRTDIKVITGGGGMQEYFKMIADEKYESLGLCSALYSPSMIEDAVNTAIKLANGESSNKIIVIPTSIVNSENVSEYTDSQNTIY